MTRQERPDRALVGQLVRRQIDRDYGGNVEEFRLHTGGLAGRPVSRDVIYRIFNGDEDVTIKTWRRIENGLRLPFDSLSLVAVHDFDQLEDEGVSPEIVGWLRKQAERGSPAGGSAAM